MKVTLNDVEVRVLGALVEKAITTPEYYPLTLNALLNACNQKSNRDPVVAFDEQIVAPALEMLREHGLIHVMAGERVPKYREYFAEAFQLDHAEVAILCELMLRGPQTIGELRGRTERFGNQQTQDEIERMLEKLELREDGPLVMRLPRQPGQKESRYAHLLGGELTIEEANVTPCPQPVAVENRSMTERIIALEEAMSQLRDEMQQMQQQFDEFKQQFE